MITVWYCQRAQNARQASADAAVWVGIEGGVELIEERLYAMAWVCILSAEALEDSTGTKIEMGMARSATFPLPDKIRDLLASGYELGTANDLLFHTKGSKSGSGAIGILTGGIIDRTELYRPVVIMALIPFKNAVFGGEFKK